MTSWRLNDDLLEAHQLFVQSLNTGFLGAQRLLLIKKKETFLKKFLSLCDSGGIQPYLVNQLVIKKCVTNYPSVHISQFLSKHLASGGISMPFVHLTNLVSCKTMQR